jgi:3-phosphoshikimate 1-carboxyvinyltransferase
METFTVPVVRGIDATARVPGSKSLANRALLCAALATGPSRLSGMPDGDDTSALIEALTHLGVGIERVETGDDMTLSVTRPLDCHATAEVRVNARLAGTTSRFLAALVALRAGPTIVDGEEPLRRRPIAASCRVVSSRFRVRCRASSSQLLP